MASHISARTAPVRVVHLITGLDTGGAETMLARLVTHSATTRVASTVVSLQAGGRLAPELTASGIDVRMLDMRPGRPSVTALARLVRLLRAVRPHVLQTWLYHADLLGLIAGTLAAVPAVVWNIRASELNFSEHPRLLRPLLWVLAGTSRWPAAVVCNSAAGRTAHERLGYRPRRWVQIPNGLDLDVFRPSPQARLTFRQELGLAPDALLIGLVARLHPMKDQPTFLDAAALVMARAPQARFVLVGRGVAGAAHLRARAAELGLAGNLHLLDERRDMPLVCAALDVAVSSSYSEGFPNTILEAMASGVPCVVTDAGESAAAVGETGIVVPARDPAALAEGMLRMLFLPPAARAALGAAARERARAEYAIARVAARYHALYEQLASETARRPEPACAG